MHPIVEVSDIDLAFPTNVVGVLIPAWEEIPGEYKSGRHPYTALVEKWFFGGLDGGRNMEIVPRDGVDTKKALRMIQAALGSFQPKHEHKMAGVAYLLDSFFSVFRLKEEQTC